MDPRNDANLTVLTLADGTKLAHVSSAPEETFHIYQEVFDAEIYALAGLDLFHPSLTTVDVGANVGIFAVWAQGKGCDRLVAIEPAHICHTALLWNLQNVFRNVEEIPETGQSHDFERWGAREGGASVWKVACSERGGERTLHVFPGMPGNSSLHLAEKLSQSHHLNPLLPSLTSHHPQPTPALPLSDILASIPGEIGLLKVDVEGEEEGVLKGVGVGDWPRIRGVIVEVHPVGGRVARIRALLENVGFDVRDDTTECGWVGTDSQEGGEKNKVMTETGGHAGRAALVWARRKDLAP